MVTGKALHGAAPKRETGAVARAHPYGRGDRVVSKRSTRHAIQHGEELAFKSESCGLIPKQP
jgi:hypothetical protein